MSNGNEMLLYKLAKMTALQRCIQQEREGLAKAALASGCSRAEVMRAFGSTLNFMKRSPNAKARVLRPSFRGREVIHVRKAA